MNASELFPIPPEKHRLKHGPVYSDYRQYKPWLRDEYEFRCVYCKIRETWFPDGYLAFQIDHLTPKSVDSTRSSDYHNLVYCCPHCNRVKYTRTMPSPCDEAFGMHYAIGSDCRPVAKTNLGRLIVRTVGMDRDRVVEFRRRILELSKILASQSEVSDRARKAYRDWFGYPGDIQDLRDQTPEVNTKPSSVDTCCFARLETGSLPNVY